MKMSFHLITCLYIDILMHIDTCACVFHRTKQPSYAPRLSSAHKPRYPLPLKPVVWLVNVRHLQLRAISIVKKAAIYTMHS